VENETLVHFVEDKAHLTAVEVRQARRSPLIAKLHRVFLGLGIVVSTYQVRAVGEGIVERIVIERKEGGGVSGELSQKARAAILPIALGNVG